MRRFVRALKIALIFVAVWILSVIGFSLIGDVFNLPDKEGALLSLYVLSILVIPAALGIGAAKQWAKKHKIIEATPKTKVQNSTPKKAERICLRKARESQSQNADMVNDEPNREQNPREYASSETQVQQEAGVEGKIKSRRESLYEYKSVLDKYNKRSYGIVLLIFLEVLFILISVFFLTVLPPLGIAMLAGCFFFLKLIIKVGKKNSSLWKVIKEYRATLRSPSISIDGDTTYCFVAPYATQPTIAKIEEILAHIGEVTKTDLLHSIVEGKILVDLKRKRKVAFYIERSESECKVRAVFKKMGNDDWWDFFLQELFDSSPNVDYGVSLANGAPQLAAVLHLGDETRQVSFSRTTGGRSLGGFLVGGVLFGTAGAVVGGLSGKQHTITHTGTVYSDTLLVRIIYNNGRLWEGSVHKGSKLYNEIMVNM